MNEEVRQGPLGESGPLQTVTAHLSLIPAGGHVLDLACGGGRHMRAALAAGFHVTGIDRDLSRVSDLIGNGRTTLIAADLERGAGLPTGGQCYDCVIVDNYLWRPLLASIVAAVKDDGVLIYETFAVGNERCGRPSRAEFLLETGELYEMARARLVVLEYRHGRVELPPVAVRHTSVGVGKRRPLLL